MIPLKKYNLVFPQWAFGLRDKYDRVQGRSHSYRNILFRSKNLFKKLQKFKNFNLPRESTQRTKKPPILYMQG